MTSPLETILATVSPQFPGSNVPGIDARLSSSIVAPRLADVRPPNDPPAYRDRAGQGDWLVIKSTHVDQADQRGLITEVHGADGAPPYVVRWLATGHAATVIPGPDAIVITAAEQEAADQQAQSRFARTPITHHAPTE